MFIKQMVKNEKPFLSENEKVALVMNNAGDGQGLIMDMAGHTADQVIASQNVSRFNDEVDEYVQKFNEHSAKLDNYANELSKNIESIEIMPIGNYVLARQFKENPFQRIVKQGSIITDLGGMAPQYKNTDNGEIEEEEQFIKVLVVVEIGPECKWVRPEDVIMATKPSLVPVPFYKQNLQLVNETRVLSVINEGLKERFNNIKKHD